MVNNNILEHAKVYFNLLPDKENEQAIIEQISNGVSFKGANLWILIFAIFIASLGLNVNSTAVIIGAMLISPLMGPIIGMGLAFGINDLDLLKRSIKNYGVATLISVLTAALYFLITPLSEAQSELLARTSPTLYDVLIAFCGGAAGIIALCTKGKSNVIPGVAIATALMPPLCTAGFGIATGHWLYFLGAFYLFFINTVFIALATFAGVRMLHFQRLEFRSAEVARRAQKILMSIVVLTMIPAAFMTVNIVRKSIFENNIRKFIKEELTQKGTHIISNTVDRDSFKLRVVAVGREISENTRQTAEKNMAFYGLRDYKLHIIQGSQSDSLMLLNNELSQINTSRDREYQNMLELSQENIGLSQQLAKYTYYETLTMDIRPELKTLFPEIKKFSLSHATEASLDTTDMRSFVTAIIQTENGKPLSQEEKNKLHDWLMTRVNADSLVIIRNDNK